MEMEGKVENGFTLGLFLVQDKTSIPGLLVFSETIPFWKWRLKQLKVSAMIHINSDQITGDL